MNTQKQIKIRLFKNLGCRLINQGELFLKKAFSVKPTKISKEILRNFLVGLGFEKYKIYCADREYYLVDWEVMKDIIFYDWTDRKKYLTDARDCDNMANAFSSHLSEIYGLNSAGLAKNVELLDPMSKKHLGWHRCNLLITIHNGILFARVYEPMSDKWELVKKGRDIVIGNWEYKLNLFEFF